MLAPWNSASRSVSRQANVKHLHPSLGIAHCGKIRLSLRMIPGIRVLQISANHVGPLQGILGIIQRRVQRIRRKRTNVKGTVHHGSRRVKLSLLAQQGTLLPVILQRESPAPVVRPNTMIEVLFFT